ncbi:hypothetical protein BC834DRAFT_492720 [Gloeopeniophorella convolvens]|nr:hypothetical protein BC834DRAFT_492720 [Gloeopeniophorella convolvens]
MPRRCGSELARRHVRHRTAILAPQRAAPLQTCEERHAQPCSAVSRLPSAPRRALPHQHGRRRWRVRRARRRLEVGSTLRAPPYFATRAATLCVQPRHFQGRCRHCLRAHRRCVAARVRTPCAAQGTGPACAPPPPPQACLKKLLSGNVPGGFRRDILLPSHSHPVLLAPNGDRVEAGTLDSLAKYRSLPDSQYGYPCQCIAY